MPAPRRSSGFERSSRLENPLIREELLTLYISIKGIAPSKSCFWYTICTLTKQANPTNLAS